MTDQLYKYPRSPHLQGSSKQQGDEDLDFIPFKILGKQELIISEKIDGANVGISFNNQGEILLQSRGHYLIGGYRERQFNLLKQWANSNALAFWKVYRNIYFL